MTQLPEVKWTPVYIPNPDRRWYQFWKPRKVLNPDARRIFEEVNELLEELSYKELPNAHP